MKKCLVLLLIGLMVLGLTLSVLAANSQSAGTPHRGTANIFERAAPAPAQGFTARVSVKPSSAIALEKDRNWAEVTTFVRKIVGGVCGFLMVYSQLGFAFVRTGSRTNNVWYSAAFSVLVYSIGRLRYQIRSFLEKFSNSKSEQEEVCYG